MKIAIIGAGASGILAALRLKDIDNNFQVDIYERENKILKKVLRSGNGRCNFGNINIDKKYYTNKNLIDLMQKYLKENNLQDSNQYLDDLGLLSDAVEDRLYPLSYDAKSFVVFLENKLHFAGVNLYLEKNITSIKIVKDKYLIDDKEYDYVIIAIGSNASLNIDDYNQYLIIKNLDLKLSNIKPGLVGFKSLNIDKNLAGVKAHVEAYLNHHKSYGEMIFKEDGISGICIMDLANYYQNDEKLIINFFPNYIEGEIFDMVKNRVKIDPFIKLYNILQGTINYKILNSYNKAFSNQLVANMKDVEILNYIEGLFNYEIKIDSLYDKNSAQVIVGGIDDSEINFFQSNKYQNIYFTGEVLDNVGICGGYNLWFAFTSGLIVANLIGEKNAR